MNKKVLLFTILVFWVIILASQIDDPFGVYEGETSYSTSLRFHVLVNGLNIAAVNDYIMAYVVTEHGPEVRGKVDIQIYPGGLGVGRTFLIYGSSDTEMIYFKLWRRAQQEVYSSNISIQAQPGQQTLGSHLINGFPINFTVPSYTISGHIRDNPTNLNPIPNIIIEMQSAVPSYDTSLFNLSMILKSNTNGYYIIPNLPVGTDITFFPTSDNHSFTPTNVTTTITTHQTRNFFEITSYSVEGTFTCNGYAVPDVVINGRNFENGTYRLSFYEGSNNILTPTKQAWAFTPPNYSFASIQNNLVQHFIGLPIETRTISGRVLHNNIGVNGVNISYEGMFTNQNSVVTDDLGNYQITVNINDSIAFIPTKAGYTFTQLFQNVVNIVENLNNRNFEANAVTYIISGSVMRETNMDPLPNVEIFSYPQHHRLAETSINGIYSFSVAHGSDINFYASKDGYQVVTPNTNMITLTNVVADLHENNFYMQTIPQYNVSAKVFSARSNIEDVNQVLIGFYKDDVRIKESITDGNGECSTLLNESILDPVSIRPIKANFNFSPIERILPTLTNNISEIQEFIININSYFVHGNVGFPGVTIFVTDIDGNLLSIVFSDENGDYGITIEHGTTIIITPQLEGFSFEPTQSEPTNIIGGTVIPAFIPNPITFLITIIAKSYLDLPIENAVVTYNSSIGYTNALGIFSFSLNWREDCMINVFKTSNIFNSILNINTGESFLGASIQITDILIDYTLQFMTRAPLQYNLHVTTSDGANNPISDVRISISGYNDVWTNTNGEYIGTIIENADLLITPIKAGYQFQPSAILLSPVVSDESITFLGSIASYPVNVSVYHLGSPFPNVNIMNNGHFEGTTNIDGQLTFFVLYGQSINLALVSTGYVFSTNITFPILVTAPLQITFNAQLQSFLIHGTIINSYSGTPIDNVQIVAEGIDRPAVYTGMFGNYSITGFYGENITLIPNKQNFTFLPQYYPLGNIYEDKTNINFTGTTYCEEIIMIVVPTLSEPSSQIQDLYYVPINVYLTCNTPNVQIWYSLDETIPLENYSLLYSNNPIPTLLYNTMTTIKAIATKSDHNPSLVVERSFKITGSTSVLSFDPPPQRLYDEIASVQINWNDDTEIVFYTINNSTNFPPLSDDIPTNALIYTPGELIRLNQNSILTARAYKEDYFTSPATTGRYEIVHSLTTNEFWPSNFVLGINMPETLNLANYIIDTIEGEHDYVAIIESTNHIHINANAYQSYVSFTPATDWSGSEFFSFRINYFPQLPYQNPQPLQPPYNTITNSFIVEVNFQDSFPVIINSYPVEDIVYINQGDVQFFSVNVLNTPTLNFEWFVNNSPQNFNSSYYETNFPDIGTNEVIVKVSTIVGEEERIWIVKTQLVSDIENTDLLNISKLVYNYPNPFNPQTTIYYYLHTEQHFSLSIYNIKGQFVTILIEGFYMQGFHEVIWDAKGQPSGIYFVVLKSQDGYDVKKVILLK